MGTPSVLGKYRIISDLGRGGMGSVHLAEDTTNGRRCALKLLSPSLADKGDFRQRFVREARYANSVRHPHIVEVYEAGEISGTPYLALQHVDGIDLKNLLAHDGPLDPVRTIAILAQVASALDAAHEAGLVHRDIKPGNVLVQPRDDGEEHAFLTDFGLSKNPSEDSIALTRAGEFVGTVDYNAPETVLGKPADHRVDVYSLGCVLLECLTGSVPFAREKDVDVLYAHIQDPPPKASEMRPGLPPEVDEVIATALAKSPSDRYSTCTELITAAWAPISRMGPIEPSAAGGPPPISNPDPTEAFAVDTGEPGDANGVVLEAISGPVAGLTIPIDEELPIGRHAPGPGALGSDPELSRRHARIARDGAIYTIEDLGSTNGTYVNGRRLTAPEVLTVGDQIRMGDSTLVLRAADPADAPSVEPLGEPEGTAPLPGPPIVDTGSLSDEDPAELDDEGFTVSEEPVELTRDEIEPPAEIAAAPVVVPIELEKPEEDEELDEVAEADEDELPADDDAVDVPVIPVEAAPAAAPVELRLRLHPDGGLEIDVEGGPTVTVERDGDGWRIT